MTVFFENYVLHKAHLTLLSLPFNSASCAFHFSFIFLKMISSTYNTRRFAATNTLHTSQFAFKNKMLKWLAIDCTFIKINFIHFFKIIFKYNYICGMIFTLQRSLFYFFTFLRYQLCFYFFA